MVNENQFSCLLLCCILCVFHILVYFLTSITQHTERLILFMSQHFEVRLEMASGFLFSGQAQRNWALILEL